ncbi:hypothetical protein PRUPE_2G171900 [Prunus persica]|uniref:Uncharacterized protein n=1 Tax=Prunus persica TaxID=3760 RepID=A0A251QHD4_PRUPE|nr:hypothetical protein PRUPE_2G171900 [Prunus persica]
MYRLPIFSSLFFPLELFRRELFFKDHAFVTLLEYLGFNTVFVCALSCKRLIIMLYVPSPWCNHN